MNGLQGAGLGHGRSNSNGTQSTISTHAAVSPIKARSAGSVGRKRTLDDTKVEQQSPDSIDTFEEKDESRIGVKRACNECRQQKVRQEIKLYYAQ